MPGVRDTFSYQNFDWKGDPRWAKTSPFTRQAPTVVGVLCLISIALVALGATWVAESNNVSFGIIVQSLIIPGLSFFNTTPSLHAHLLLRRNPPTLALTTGIIFSIMMILSPILMLSSCVHSPDAASSLRKAECYKGTPGHGGDSGISLSVWAPMVALSLLSGLGYSVHAVMAWKVRSHLRWKRREGIVDAPDPEEEERRKQKARELWIEMTRRDVLV